MQSQGGKLHETSCLITIVAFRNTENPLASMLQQRKPGQELSCGARRQLCCTSQWNELTGDESLEDRVLVIPRRSQAAGSLQCRLSTPNNVSHIIVISINGLA